VKQIGMVLIQKNPPHEPRSRGKKAVVQPDPQWQTAPGDRRARNVLKGRTMFSAVQKVIGAGKLAQDAAGEMRS
jgi:hypothetical protein